MSILQIPKHTTHLVLYNAALLGTAEAEVWVGRSPDGPLDNDDARVLRERKQPHDRIAGIAAMQVYVSADYPGWYEIDMHAWAPGTYRWNIHSKAGIQAPNGTILRQVRDGEYSWPHISDELLASLSKEQQSFLYLEPNGGGFCIRTHIDEQGMVTPAGNGAEWIPNWQQIKQDVAKHYEDKMNKAISVE